MYYLGKEKNMRKQSYSTIGLYIRALLFLIYAMGTMIPFSFIILISAIFPLSFRHLLIRSYLRAYLYMLKLICHLDYEIEGLENIPNDRNGIILCKHQSTFETFLLPTIFHQPAIILKKELYWLPFFGWGLALSDPIAINRSQKGSAMQQIIEKGKKRLDDGRWVLVFPEGTRVAPGTVGQYKLGGPRLAAATGYPVIPIAHNAGRYWPKRKFIKKPGTIRVVIGPLIESKGRTPEEILALAKDWIETTMTRIDRLVDKPTRQ